MSDWMRRDIRPNHWLEISPHVGHVHIVDEPSHTGINTQRPVSFANDLTGERFRIGPETTLREAFSKYREFGLG